MTSELADPQRLLQAGIQAAKAGDRARARELLLRAVELDEKVALTWIWLSEVMDDPADKVTALENALVLDPDNTAIKNRLSQLLAQVNLPQTAGLSPPEAAWPAAPEAQPEENTRVRVEGSIEDWRDYLPEVPLESDDGIDDPYQCPYCGRMTGVTDSKCPHCKGRLYFSVSKSQHSEFLRFAQLLVGISLGTGIAGLLSPLLATNLRGSDSAEYVLSIFGVQAFFGDFQRISPAAAAMLIQGHLLRAAVMLGLLLLLSQRWAFIFYSAIALMLADLLWNTYLLLTGYLLIRAGRREAHRRAMSAVLCCSALFLSSYLVYHWNVGSVPFRKTGPIRTVYFAILISHTSLAVAIVPMVFLTAVRAWRQHFEAPRHIASRTLPLWGYVSVTGVIVYWMLYPL